jgi:uncharacterized protein
MTDACVEPGSPCIGVCALDERDVCIGCYRSAAEIAAWSSLGAGEKRAVLVRADRRYQEQWGLAPAR